MAIGQVILRMDQLLVELLAALFENLAVIAVVSVDLISGALLVIFAVVTVVAVVVVVVVVVDDIGLVAVVVPHMLSTSPLLLLLLLLSLLFFWHTSKPEKSLSISRSKVSKLKA